MPDIETSNNGIVQARPTRPLQIDRRSVRSYRFVRAYLTTFQVVFSYLWLSFGRKTFGEGWYGQRVVRAHKRNARRVEATVVTLQGLFIKVGQLLSIMANFLPEEFRAGLERLQDQVPPRPFSEIQERIELEFGKPVDQVFERLDRAPLASASLGQVHEARTRDGTRVAVKVQHKHIDEVCRLDLTTIRRIMWIVSFFFPIRGLDAYYHQIREMISRELDFEGEANSIERIADNFSHDPKVLFPRVVRELSTRRVLTTTFVDGVKIGDVAGLEAMGIDRKELARRVVRVYCQMIFVDGVYHADPHPGNMLVTPEGNLILLDFGAVGELSTDMREGIPEFLEAVVRRDTERLIKAMRKMRFLVSTSDSEVSEKVIEFLHRKFQEEVKLESFNLKDIKVDPQKGFENLLDLRKMNIGLRELSGAFQIPREWVLLERTLLLLTGVCTQLDPEMNPMDVVRPYLNEFVFGNRDWAQIAIEAAKDMALRAITLPEELHKYLSKSVRGEMEIRVKGMTDSARLIYAAAHQLVYAASSIAFGMAALQLFLAGHEEGAQWCLAGTGVMATLFVVSLLLARRK
ncbi:MAG: AarF/ABC1/UbiB kinase family protein [Deltaproteobacteria bacterium]|nr:AarF/ABC1/UbiB kinase family protein [Deltaproteobacteria bacterium]